MRRRSGRDERATRHEESTHSDECWRRHLDCAVKDVERGRAEAERLRQERLGDRTRVVDMRRGLEAVLAALRCNDWGLAEVQARRTLESSFMPSKPAESEGE